MSVLVVGEVRLGIENIRERDQISARALDRWIQGVVRDFGDRILPVDLDVAEAWGMLGAGDPLPPVDALVAATAKVHGLTVATRNKKHFDRTGASWVNPFRSPG